MRHWGAEQLLNGAERCWLKKKGWKKDPRVWGAAGSVEGGCAGPPFLRGSAVSPSAAKPPQVCIVPVLRVLPGAALEGIQARGYL